MIGIHIRSKLYDNEVVRSARHLLSLLTSGSAAGPSQDNASIHRPVQQRATIQTEMTRSFPGFFSKGRGKRRMLSVPSSKPAKILPVSFYLLPHQYERTPKESEQLVHMQAGLGRKTMQMDENATNDEVCAQLKELFPKFQEVKGGWLVYKASGGWGSRKLTLIPPHETGYSAKQLKAVTQGFKGVLYIAPLQMELDTTALPPESESFNDMRKEKCQKCGITFPLVILTTHIKCCVTTDEAEQSNDEAEQTKQATFPICQKEMSLDVIEIHASFCTDDSTQPLEFNASMEEPSTSGFSMPVTQYRWSFKCS
ncbi:uncharacterized protein LOC130558660 isoform X2 [Triplophysa rosa]|uniref:uncharacterized protein LOC130558660 isoform X2 n=1 Tax=Triplophysa rosa TaxID=992332 RepID=UPI002545FC6B|nr:uncharacterized protein LOC130558660 isoform X2 [Triplophysa rosa]XP_057197202.1 uncharacterized protein LOC130558660 isoform X2 [Triplophysa rosa]XP_057197203.1 uncharacterized protein LOC130558660 isoform X2 [Triplophysa rosa]XP_057197204.1 uncharacterized protein LOC130558660 isoform X2 [Triplophysa rosa]XP_057197206.1 uncharacterized protein LOC130558660 isoform X2 [Triplophysa rosa]XP_057197207.1 uncharacterized protein LOC130558660 isoform X2 [Triplophysa rosa]XP_057197208.1 uncharac